MSDNPKLVCIARCKNEIHNIERWITSLSFVDTFCIVDNGSTDGTLEYLKKLDNVVLTRTEGFNEGRDLVRVLKIAQALEPMWILKLDCDEFFEPHATSHFIKLLNQLKFDSFFFRTYTFDYRIPENQYLDSAGNEIINPRLGLVRNDKFISYMNIKSHVGAFKFYSNPALSNFRIKHYSSPSKEKAQEKFDTYNSMKSDNDNRPYQHFIDDSKKYIDSLKTEAFDVPEGAPPLPFNSYGIPSLIINDSNSIEIVWPTRGKSWIKKKIKLLISKLTSIVGLNDFYLKLLIKRIK